MSTKNKRKYSSHFTQLKDDQHLDDQIDKFLLQEKIDEERSKDLRDELNEQEEQYLAYLEQRLQETENRILETQNLVNNRNIKDQTELKQIKELNSRIEKLVDQKEQEKSRFLTQDLNENVKEYIFKLQEENKRLNEERNQFEIKYLFRNKQIQILIREIKLYKKNDKYFQDVIMNKEKQIKDNAKQLNKFQVESNDALRRIEYIEKNRQKNVIQLPKMEKQVEPHIENDPYNFWRQDIITDVVQNISKKHQKVSSLKDIIPHEDLWVLEQEKGKKKIDGIDAEKTYAESPQTLYQMPHRIQSSKVNLNDAQMQEVTHILPIKPQTSFPQGGNAYQSSQNMRIQDEYYHQNSQNNIFQTNQESYNNFPSKTSIKSNQYYQDPNDITNQYQQYQYNKKKR
ncbi:hypothetical protein ABPG72_019392 [Tetrahymena utriculariae]